MTIEINSLIINNNKIIIGYENKPANEELTGKGYFYRIAYSLYNSYKSVINSNPSYVIDFWGNNLIGNTLYKTEKSPYYNYPYTSTQLANKNLLDIDYNTLTTKPKCLYCVGGVDGFDPSKIYESFNSEPGKRLKDIYDGIVLDIETIPVSYTKFSDLWTDIKKIADLWQNKYIIFCVISAGCGYTLTDVYTGLDSDKLNIVNNFIKPMYQYINNNNNAYLAPMLYGGNPVTASYQFITGIPQADNIIYDEYKKYNWNKKLIPILLQNSQKTETIADFKSSSYSNYWNWNGTNYMLWDNNPIQPIQPNQTFAYILTYADSSCPNFYNFGKEKCPYKPDDSVVPIKCINCWNCEWDSDCKFEN